MNVTIESLTTYPLKSAGGCALTSTRLKIDGLPSDRRWMLVDEAGRFVSQRRLPKMALLSTSLSTEGIQIGYPGRHSLVVNRMKEGDSFRVTMHRPDENLEVFGAGEEAAQWFTECFEDSSIDSLRLVRLVNGFARRIPDRPEDNQQQVQLSDGYPFLVACQSSLDLLNERFGVKSGMPLEMERFRPNIVLGGTDPWSEMKNGQVLEDESGSIRLRLVKPCQRCTIPQVDPTTGERDLPAELHEVLRELDRDRESPLNCFGQNAILESGHSETLSVGQSLRLLSA